MKPDFLTYNQKLFFDFVTEKHGDQKRKYTGEPYTNHLLNVAKILYDHEQYHLIEIALGHDLLEDTECKVGQIFLRLKEIGYSNHDCSFIIEGIIALTDVYIKEDFTHLNRKTRKELEAIRLGSIQSAYQTVKYADLLDNGRDIIGNDPNGFARKYIQEMSEILSLMYVGDRELHKQAKILVNSFICVRSKDFKNVKGN